MSYGPQDGLDDESELSKLQKKRKKLRKEKDELENVECRFRTLNLPIQEKKNAPDIERQQNMSKILLRNIKLLDSLIFNIDEELSAIYNEQILSDAEKWMKDNLGETNE